MTPDERVIVALEMFDEFLVEGLSIDDALAAAAAENDLKPEVMRIRAEKGYGDLSEHLNVIRFRTVYNHFLSAAKIEVESCKQNPVAYGCTSLIDLDGKIIKIKERLENTLGRQLSEHERLTISEMLDPVVTHMKIMKFNDPETLEILRQRAKHAQD